jgi:hypothetical protein
MEVRPMRDDQIRDLLRTLEDDRVPDPAFADDLHATLAGMSHRRARRWPLVLLAAAAVLALAGGAALGSGLIDPPVTAEATPTPSRPVEASATATPSPTPSVAAASPTASPSADPQTPAPTRTPDQATALGVPPGLLPPGAVVVTTGEGVRIREEPTTSAEIVATMSAGDSAYVQDVIRAGPFEADGYEWYPIAYAGGEDVWPWQDVAPDGLVSGWVAAGDDTRRFVDLAEVTCPTEPPTLEVLALELTDWARLVCLSGTTVTLEAADFCRQEGFGGCGGTTPGAQPVWLADVTQHAPMVPPGNFGYPFVRVAIPPELLPAYDDLPLGRVLRITLHVDDPVADTCALSAEPDEAGRTADPEAVRVYCRERMVLESFEDIGENDLR